MGTNRNCAQSYLTNAETLEAFVRIQKKKYDKAGYTLDQLQSFCLAVGTHITASIVFASYRHLVKHPFSINRFAIFHLEKPFGWKCEQPLSQTKMDYLDYLVDQRIEDLRRNPEVNFWKGILLLHKEEQPNDPEFPFYFALTLRQTNVIELPAFLRAKSSLFNKDYLKFLELLLVDFDDLFVSKTKEVVKKWIDNQKKELALLKKTAFLPIPKRWKKIDGRLSPAEVKAAFAFLYRIADFTTDKKGYLEKDEVEGLLQYGIAYPGNEDDRYRLTLSIDQEKSGRLFFYCIFQIMKSHERIARDTNYKTAWAYFLKHRFTNFANMSMRSIKNEIRNRLPKSAPIGFISQN